MFKSPLTLTAIFLGVVVIAIVIYISLLLIAGGLGSGGWRRVLNSEICHYHLGAGGEVAFNAHLTVCDNYSDARFAAIKGEKPWMLTANQRKILKLKGML